ncbi:MAG: GNAT family N-acetyltransferase [Actinomycetota bacterium]
MPWTEAVLCTNRLTLRALGEGDRALVRELLTNPRVRRYLGGPVEIPADFDANPLGRRPGVWCVSHNGKPIGTVSIADQHHQCPELSYDFLPMAWGNGYAKEASQAVLAWFWDAEPECRVVIAVTQLANDRSLQLLARLGFVETRRFEEFGAQQSWQELVRPN